jgi:hypothetical protein
MPPKGGGDENMPALCERIHPEHEERIPLDIFTSFLTLWVVGDMTVQQLRSFMTLTQDESDELDTLLAAAPADISGLSGLLAPLAPLAQVPRFQWVEHIRAILMMFETDGVTGYQTAEEMRGLLGLPPLEE